MRRVWGVAALLTALALAPARSARADQQTDDFKTHVQRAKVHYDLGEFDEAADEYIEAYRIKPIAGALFNIAQAYRQAGKYDKSRQFYRSYLREANPEGKTKAQVEKQIKELDELIAKEEKTKRSAPTGVQPSLAGKDELSPPGHDELAPPPSAASTKARPADELAPPSGSASAAAPVAAQGAPSSVQAPSGRPQAAPAPSASASQSSAASSATTSAGTVAMADSRRKPPAASTAPSAQTAPAPAAAVRPDATGPSASSGGRSHTLAYVAAGAAVLLLGGGTLFGVEAARTDNELTAGAHARADADSLISTSKSDHTLSAVLLIAGAAAAVGAGLLYFLPTSGPSGGGGAAVGGHF